ncbi:MAG: sialate O-acetylesterase, partial [Verrucomicrobia bacterium]|nr:sialate O-acetylesterase [Verrucomicrobiota bacterium]
MHFVSRRARLIFTALAAVCLDLLAAAPARAAVRLPHIFSDRMILQRDQLVSVWGWADPGETVAVRVAGQDKPATAGADGKWNVTLDPLRLGPAVTMTVAGASSTVTVADVLIGDVFLCSGQSNMAMSLDAAKRHPGAAEDVAAANFPRLRFFKTPDVMSKTQEEDVVAAWEAITPRNLAGFSAVAFYFGRALHTHLSVPIGLIRASHGGGPAEAKMPRAALLTLDIGRRYDEEARKREAAWTPERIAAFNADNVAKWEAAMKDAAARGAKPPAKPTPRTGAIDFAYPASDYNAQIAPVIRFTKRAVLWYQGEH